MEDFIYDFFKRPNPDSIREKAVYYKNRELRRREEPWQPKGRVTQDYDILFEDTDWRDMLKKRIGVLDRDSILSKKSSHDNIIRLNTTFNFNDLFITI